MRALGAVDRAGPQSRAFLEAGREKQERSKQGDVAHARVVPRDLRARQAGPDRNRLRKMPPLGAVASSAEIRKFVPTSTLTLAML